MRSFYHIIPGKRFVLFWMCDFVALTRCGKLVSFFMFYVVYMCQRSLNFVDAFMCYKQKWKWRHLIWPILYTIFSKNRHYKGTIINEIDEIVQWQGSRKTVECHPSCTKTVQWSSNYHRLHSLSAARPHTDSNHLECRMQSGSRDPWILEIWGRAQHEAARRPTSDLKYILGDCNVHKNLTCQHHLRAEI